MTHELATIFTYVTRCRNLLYAFVSPASRRATVLSTVMTVVSVVRPVASLGLTAVNVESLPVDTFVRDVADRSYTLGCHVRVVPATTLGGHTLIRYRFTHYARCLAYHHVTLRLDATRWQWVLAVSVIVFAKRGHKWYPEYLALCIEVAVEDDRH